jgi:hypothetical protein
MLSFVMSWFAWLGLAVLITAVAAITGIKPKGTRHVAHTRLMGVARLVLLAIVIIFAYLAFRARSGGWRTKVHAAKESGMAINFQRNIGMLLLAVWLILYGLAGMIAVGLPAPLMAVLALLAGILILVGR